MAFNFDSIANYLRDSLKNSPSAPFLDPILTKIKNACLEEKEIDYGKLLQHLKEKNVIYMDNPLTFISKCTIFDITCGRFSTHEKYFIEKATHTILDLANEFKSRNFKICNSDLLIIEHYLIYIREKNLLTLPKTREWIFQALDYLVNNNKKDTKNFILLFRNTRAMRALRLPYEKLDKEAKELVEQWETLIEELEVEDK